mmetsp:Transcript_34661/g.62434  ORF Transcript_34661/g.62434 Transcript_34661/m.62434 type:complete len:108 (-) Transcript_34661:108-431(-)|eukprot:CAMPEP_0175061260 /NCGR_PEP_ID=MMETSP0052_2-20121109/13485_1 /TAXON_ID=51329 ORGANISM="Polytomella parva, Strain SAG 63-3" /NCGR_SAMPLE_ID=MMETSP0052_2 /ASSEMBLY_ACC=CAM_ASM_000194 /LENGTH=107 /DNA_ID=CAMNT_0016327093 /DNA_START=15 /DNA_END=338 /DNA_ORIENTATION=+
MAKGSRSNSRKKLQTTRAEALNKQSTWRQDAEVKKQEALAKCMASDPVSISTVSAPIEEEKMDSEDSMEMEVEGSKKFKGNFKRLSGIRKHKGGKKGGKKAGGKKRK